MDIAWLLVNDVSVVRGLLTPLFNVVSLLNLLVVGVAPFLPVVVVVVVGVGVAGDLFVVLFFKFLFIKYY